jgi:hypothetical protein
MKQHRYSDLVEVCMKRINGTAAGKFVYGNPNLRANRYGSLLPVHPQNGYSDISSVSSRQASHTSFQEASMLSTNIPLQAMRALGVVWVLAKVKNTLDL